MSGVVQPDRNKPVVRAYVVRGRILDWRPAAYVAAKQPKQLQAPVCPDNFAELTPEQKQNSLLSNAMYLQARLLSSGLALDAKAIAQLAAVAQGIVRTSVELEQLKVDRNAMDSKREEKIRILINKFPGRPREQEPPRYLVPRIREE